MFVLDTNMVSLAMRGDSRVIDHLKAVQGDDLLISAVTLAEIEYSLARLPRSARGPSKRASELRELFDALLTYMGILARPERHFRVRRSRLARRWADRPAVSRVERS